MRVAIRLSEKHNDKLWRLGFQAGYRSASKYIRSIIENDMKKPLKKLPKIPPDGIKLEHNTSIIIDDVHMDHLVKQKDIFGLAFATEYLRALIRKEIDKKP